MSKPDDIPQEVWDAAREIVFTPYMMEWEGTAAVSYAILSERTKAAELYKALREIAAHEPSDGNHNLNDLIAHASVKTASQAIRKGGKE